MKKISIIGLALLTISTTLSHGQTKREVIDIENGRRSTFQTQQDTSTTVREVIELPTGSKPFKGVNSQSYATDFNDSQESFEVRSKEFEARQREFEIRNKALEIKREALELKRQALAKYGGRSHVSFNNRREYLRKKKVRYFDVSGHWMGFSMGYNGLVQSLGHLSLPTEADFLSQASKSINVNVNLINLGIVSSRHFGLITGLGMEMNNFHFDKNITLTNVDGIVVPDLSFSQNDITLKKTKLSTNYFTIPLLAELRIPTARKHEFYLYGGVIGGWCFNEHTKVKYYDGHRQKDKNDKGLNIRNFRYGYTTGLGYSNIGLYATYYPNSIFRAGKGPDVSQVNIGVSLNFGRGF